MSLGGIWSERPLHADDFFATWQAIGNTQKAFIKTQEAKRAETMHAEADGLAALQATSTLRVPGVLGVLALANGGAALALEWLELTRPGPGLGACLGSALATLHRSACTLAPPAFGWPRENWLGGTSSLPRRIYPASGLCAAAPAVPAVPPTQPCTDFRPRLPARSTRLRGARVGRDSLRLCHEFSWHLRGRPGNPRQCLPSHSTRPGSWLGIADVRPRRNRTGRQAQFRW